MCGYHRDVFPTSSVAPQMTSSSQALSPNPLIHVILTAVYLSWHTSPPYFDSTCKSLPRYVSLRRLCDRHRDSITSVVKSHRRKINTDNVFRWIQISACYATEFIWIKIFTENVNAVHFKVDQKCFENVNVMVIFICFCILYYTNKYIKSE